MASDNPLGREARYPKRYAPEVLHDIERSAARSTIGVFGDLPFHGVDSWTAWELAWLDDRERLQIACARIEVPADSPRMVESKSLKLYLNSFCGTSFASPDEVKRAIVRDLRSATGSTAAVEILDPAAAIATGLTPLPGSCLDDLPVTCRSTHVDPDRLRARDDEIVSEQVYTNLFMSHCPVTDQPDWASVIIDYAGPRMNHPSLLHYLQSYRNHQGYHENCVERIFVDVQLRCSPETLSVLALFTRRGGIDINPFRSTDARQRAPRLRAWRQ